MSLLQTGLRSGVQEDRQELRASPPLPHPHLFIFVCVIQTDTRPVSETFLSAEGLQDAYIDSQAYF